MADKKRTYKKRTYKKRYYKKRYYKKRRYFKRSNIKKPEMHIVENDYYARFDDENAGVGRFINLTNITSNLMSDYDQIQYKINGKNIDGKKIRLKYLYIKGYIHMGTYSAGNKTGDNDVNIKLMLFRWKRNINNNNITWDNLVNLNSNVESDPVSWSATDKLWMMYKADWKNDIKINFYKKVKNLYRKYDNANNIIPFKIRVPLYDCVLTCDNKLVKSEQGSQYDYYEAYKNPSTNGLYFTFLSNNTLSRDEVEHSITYKAKLYFTDY